MPSAAMPVILSAAHASHELSRPDLRLADPTGACASELCYARRRMRIYSAVIERDAQTGFYVGYVPGWPGAHSQGETMDDVRSNLEEVIAMLLEDGEPSLEAEFVGTQTLRVA